MDINYIALAIPVFLLLIGVELAFAWHEKKDFYRFNDAVNDMSCGIADQVVGIFSKVLIFALHTSWHHYELCNTKPQRGHRFEQRMLIALLIFFSIFRQTGEIYDSTSIAGL